MSECAQEFSQILFFDLFDFLIHDHQRGLLHAELLGFLLEVTLLSNGISLSKVFQPVEKFAWKLDSLDLVISLFRASY